MDEKDQEQQQMLIVDLVDDRRDLPEGQ